MTRPGATSHEGEPETGRHGRLALALVLGWLVPGAGHAVIGRVRRGALFAGLVFLSFGLGVAHDGRFALQGGDQPVLTGLQLVANAGVGIADLVGRIAVYGEPAYFLPRSTSRPEYQERMAILRDRASIELSNYGTAYLWTAGLMNLLLLFDVYDVWRGRKP